MASPPNASMSVAVADVWSGQRPAAQFSPSASTIWLGAGSGKPRIWMLLTSTSQTAMVTTKTRIAGR